jgi:N-acyl homoserine lactone hydrolase
MTQVRRFWPLLTAFHTYDKTVSTRGRGRGENITAPVLAYLIESSNGRILYDLGCDHRKLQDPLLRQRFYGRFPFDPPVMRTEDHLPARLAALGLNPLDVDAVFLGHLHFDHAGGLHEFLHAEIHVHENELAAAIEPADDAYFADDFACVQRWRRASGEYELVPGVQAIETPGHTHGHMSMLIELPEGNPILLCGDAADLMENLEDEVAPGLCYRNQPERALQSIRKLKQLAKETGAELWPNHDLSFFQARNRFPLPFR